MFDDGAMIRMLGMLAAAPTDQTKWADLLTEVCTISGVSNAAIFSHDMKRDEHPILARRGESLDAGAASYASHYWQFDEWGTRRLRNDRPGQVMLGEEVWPEAEFRKSLFYNEYLKPLDLCQITGIAFSTPSLGLLDNVSFLRGPREKNFGEAPRSILEALSPHLQVAFKTRRRLVDLEKQIGTLEAALDSLRSALLLVGPSGSVLYLNRRAKTVLSQQRSLFIHRGKLMARNPGDTASLGALIEKATNTAVGRFPAGGGAMAIRREEGRPLHVLVSPISRDDPAFPQNTAAAVFLDDPELQPLIPEEVLRTLFRLSPAEARLALSIVDGQSISAAAERVGVSRETAKSQMSAVFLKTETRRQGELIRLLSKLPCEQAR